MAIRSKVRTGRPRKRPHSARHDARCDVDPKTRTWRRAIRLGGRARICGRCLKLIKARRPIGGWTWRDVTDTMQTRRPSNGKSITR